MMRFSFGIIMLVGIFNVSISQELPPMGGPGAERVESFKKIRLMEALKLDEETSIKFFSRYNRHRESLRAIAEKRNAIIDQLQHLTKSKKADAEFDKEMKLLLGLESEVSEARNTFYTELKEIMTRKQIAEYVVFERKFAENLRELAKDIMEERAGRIRRRNF